MGNAKMRRWAGYGAALLLAGLAAAPAGAQRGDGMGAFPIVTEGPGDTLLATFYQNQCVITYDARTGRELTSRAACTAAQRGFADQAIADFARAGPSERLLGRDAYGRDVTVDRYRARDRRRGGYRAARYGRERPLVQAAFDGTLSVSFRAPVCIVYYRANGRRAGATQYCTRAQLRQADAELDGWLDAQGR
jgi:hypothetical protein